jgi:hypothetical protein
LHLIFKLSRHDNLRVTTCRIDISRQRAAIFFFFFRLEEGVSRREGLNRLEINPAIRTQPGRQGIR